MEVYKGISVDYKDGSLILAGLEGAVSFQVKAGLLLVPAIDGIIAKVESGEIDLVKGTDIEKGPVLEVLKGLKAALVK